MIVSLPEPLADAFWAAQAAYTRMEAKGLEPEEYQRRSRGAADLFGEAFDQTMLAASRAGDPVASKADLAQAIRELLRIVLLCEDPSPSIPAATDALVHLPEAVLADAIWAASIIRPIRRTTPLLTRTRMELRDALFHMVVASQHDSSGDEEQASAHVAMGREHIVLAGEEALEYAVRLNLIKVRETFSQRNIIGRMIIGPELPARQWGDDQLGALVELGEARRQKGRPETTGLFEARARTALDVSIELANAVDQGKIAPWRLAVDTIVVAGGLAGVIILIVSALP